MNEKELYVDRCAIGNISDISI